MKKYIIISLITIIIILILIATYLVFRSNPSPFENNPDKTPTITQKIEITKAQVQQINVSGEELEVISNNGKETRVFTGAMDEEFSKEEKEEIDQRRGLRLRAPYDGVTFYIDFDYSSDKFNITLNPDNEQSKQEFLNWIQENYPSLINEEFIYE